MAKLSASSIFGKLKVTGEAIVNKALTVKDKIILKNKEGQTRLEIDADNSNFGDPTIIRAWDGINETHKDRIHFLAGERTTSGNYGAKLLEAGTTQIFQDTHLAGELYADNDVWVGDHIRTGDGGSILNSNGNPYVDFNANQSLNTGGALSEQGDRVATRTWTGNNYVSESGDKINGDLQIGEFEIKGNWPSARFGVDSSHNITSTSAFSITQNQNDDQFEFTYQSGTSGDSFNTNSALIIGDAGNVEVPDGQLSEQGNRVATRTWTGNNYVSESGDTMTGDLGIQAGQAITDDSGNIRMNVEDTVTSINNATGETVLQGGGTNVTLYDGNSNPRISMDANGGTTTFSNGNIDLGLGVEIEDNAGTVTVADNLNSTGQISEQSNRVATRTWATGSNIDHADLADAPSSAHHAKYTDSEARSAVDGSSLSTITLNGVETSNDNAYVKTSGTGTGSWSITDTSNQNHIAEFEEGGDVNIPNGSLIIDGTTYYTANSTDTAVEIKQDTDAGRTRTVKFKEDDGTSGFLYMENGSLIFQDNSATKHTIAN